MTYFRSHCFILYQYLVYWLKATNQYSLQAPFVFQFFNQVISDKRAFYVFEEIEDIRNQLLRDFNEIEVSDLGAGSQIHPGNKRKISFIAHSSLSSAKFSQFLFRLIINRRPGNIIELGTSLGINTLYLAKANTTTPVFTMEGCPRIANIAKTNFRELNCKNINLITGNIDDNLPKVLCNNHTVDFVFFDANHTKEATLKYFLLCLPKVNNKSIFVFDDIHLSPDMYHAWKIIEAHPEVTMSIDIFEAGIIFFDKGLQKRNYILEF